MSVGKTPAAGRERGYAMVALLVLMAVMAVAMTAALPACAARQHSQPFPAPRSSNSGGRPRVRTAGPSTLVKNASNVRARTLHCLAKGPESK